MTKKKAERILDDFLTPLLSTIGFQRIGSLDYSRPTSEAVGLLTFDCIETPDGFAFGCGVAMHFKSLDQWLRDDDDRATIAGLMRTPIHFLREDRTYTSWMFRDVSDLESQREAIVADLQSLAIPFIEQFSRLSNLRKAVESPREDDRYILNPDRRVTVLAAIKLVQGDQTGALKTLEDALREREGMLPKHWFDIKHLQKKILASNSHGSTP